MDEFTKVKEVLRINCFCPIGLAPAAGTKDASLIEISIEN
jgi:hypothetical protein